MLPERLRIDLDLVQPDVELRLHADDRHGESRALQVLLLHAAVLGVDRGSRHFGWTAQHGLSEKDARNRVGISMSPTLSRQVVEVKVADDDCPECAVYPRAQRSRSTN